MAAITAEAIEPHSSGESFQPTAAVSVASPAHVLRSFSLSRIVVTMPSAGCQSLACQHRKRLLAGFLKRIRGNRVVAALLLWCGHASHNHAIQPRLHGSELG